MGPQAKKKILEMMNDSGCGYWEAGLYEKANICFLKMLEIGGNNHNGEEIFYAYGNVAETYLMLGKYSLARYYWERLPFDRTPALDGVVIIEMIDYFQSHFNKLFPNDPEEVFPFLSSKLKATIAKIDILYSFSIEEIYNAFDELVEKLFPQKHDATASIMNDVVTSFSINNDVFVNWSDLTDIHQAWVDYEFPNIPSSLRLSAAHILNSLKTSNSLFS